MEKLSRLARIYERLGAAIQNYTDEYGDKPFEDVPIRWDMIEVTPNDLPPVCIILSGLVWRYDITDCVIERQLDIGITYTSKQPREITLALTKFSEDMVTLLKDVMFSVNDFELQFLQGSEIGYLQDIKEDDDSYKTQKTVFDSIIVLSYLLRY